ncbi:MAG: helix-turn-helix transcriptional regulator [Anaerolineales bacterium]|nr:helix-turn-helix transcriptional regulator [Anaerolineales bacterium]
MSRNKDFEKQLEFWKLLKTNQLKSPNEFTIGMGDLIRKAREEKGLSQAQLAKIMNKRQGTISDVENGKYEIGILTLVHFAVELQKPISSFFPPNLFTEKWTSDANTPFEKEVLEFAKFVEPIGDKEFVLKILEDLENYFYKQMDMEIHPEEYMQPPNDENE